MAFNTLVRTLFAGALAGAIYLAAVATAAIAADATLSPLALNTARVSVEGTSNVHSWTASTTTVRLARVQLAAEIAGPNFLDAIVRADAVRAFDVVIPTATLGSPKGDLDKNMHKALKAQEHPDITFRLLRLEARGDTPGSLRGVGMLTIAGVEREVALDLVAARKDATLHVKGETTLLMTDFGITPPKAMMGMLRTDPKVIIRFETVLSISLT